jgi:NAD(P)H-nitrite reductase large subunit
MNKGRRTELANLKKKSRLKIWINDLYWFRNKEGELIQNPKITDIDSRHINVFKSTGKPCSCTMCSPKKYNRTIKHKNIAYEKN